jgi:zinc protease
MGGFSMTMRFGKGLALCVAAWFALATMACASAFAAPTWPTGSGAAEPDPAVRFGVLPNGLRYAIMHNETPKGQAAMRLQIHAGSMHEGPGQEGLAHFVEHMAFRGSKKVADGEMIPSLERLGLQFGPDTNASTSPTVTTYMFNLPRSDEASIGQGLFLLREIASELTLDPSIAKTESGVVLSEERARAGEQLEVAKAQNALVFGDHPVSRLPIGKTEVIEAADVKQMRAFYDAWYRPERAVLVVVGDIDVEAIETRIRGQFSDWVGKGPAGTDPAPLGPSGRSPQFVALDGKPLVGQVILAWVKPYELLGDTDAERLERLTRSVALSAFSTRMASVVENAGKPFALSNLSEGVQIGASRTVTLQAILVNDWKASLDLLVKSKSQLVAYGFTQDEIDQVLIRAKASPRRPWPRPPRGRPRRSPLACSPARRRVRSSARPSTSRRISSALRRKSRWRASTPL